MAPLTKRRQKKLDVLRQTAMEGLSRAALSGGGDALRMLCMDEETLLREADRLDLLCVSEIKRQKGEITEIKFIDRVKALEAVCRLTEQKEDTGTGAELLQALYASTGRQDGREP